MASGSASSPPSTNLASRFSTLKVFKFSSKEKDLRPPPPPPKDEYYLRNRSLASLSPDSFSLPPNSPLSPQYPFQFTRQPSPEPNPSSMSFASSAASIVLSPPPESKGRPQSRGKERALGFLKFAKRTPRSPSMKDVQRNDEMEPPPPVEDENISMPFNFQHNIHVDDGLTGLPPSWSTSLAAVGFSEEEITDLQNRRPVGARSPSSQYFSARPQSPSIQHPYQNGLPVPPACGPIIAHPSPRSTSLPRQFSNASLKSGTQQAQQRPPIPFAMSTAASSSTSSLHSSKAGSISSNARLVPLRHLGSQDHFSGQHSSQLSMSYSSESHYSDAPGSESRDQGPLAPVRLGTSPADHSTQFLQPFHVANTSIAGTPPSSGATSSKANGHNRNESTASSSKQRVGKQSEYGLPSSFTLRRRADTDASESRSTSSNMATSVNATPNPNGAASQTKASPPRLSLHKNTDSADLSWWTQALLSGISGDTLDGKLTLGTPTSPQSAPASATPQAPPARPYQSRPTPPVLKFEPSRYGSSLPSPLLDEPIKGRNKPEPLSSLEEAPASGQYAEVSPPWSSDLPSSNSPLWSELEGMLGGSKATAENEADHIPGPYSAALADASSPTLPFSPEEERIAAERKKRSELRGKEDTSNGEDSLNRLSVNTARPNRDSSRSSTSTISTSTVTGIIASSTIVRTASVARRAGAYVIDKSSAGTQDSFRERELSPGTSNNRSLLPGDPRYPPSPLSSLFDSEDGSASGSASSSSQSQGNPTPTTDSGLSPLLYYLEPSPEPTQGSFSPTQLKPQTSIYDSRNVVDEDDSDIDNGSSVTIPAQVITTPSPPVNRPTIVISDAPPLGLSTAIPSGSGTPLSPFQRYRGWLSEVVTPLEEYIDESVDPRDHYLDLKEIAEGESGSVFSARLIEKDAHKLRLPPLTKARDRDEFSNGRSRLVAIKSVAIVPSGSPKLKDLQHELSLMRGLWHENIIGLDALYVDLLEDTLWIRMELMERSLADIIGLVDSGLMLQDRMIGRFASDILKALEYLEKHRIAHRDVRSDNLLINKRGFLKLTDFANAVQVTAQNPMRSEPAGVLYWQAPEIRSPPYNTLKVDVWSLGATIWEMAETQPPFADTNQFEERWPPVSNPELYSPGFHDFLRKCSEPAASRPTASELLRSPFITNACGRPVIVQLLSQCIAIETALQGGDVA